MTWLQRLVRNRRLEHELDAELRDHLERQVADHVRRGLSEQEARRLARLEFGGLDQVKEVCRDARGLRLVDEMMHDVRMAIRALRATPIVSAVAVLSLALGIGANTAIFSLVNSLLLRPLPVAGAQRLVTVVSGTDEVNAERWTYGIWDQIRQRARLFDGAAAWSAQPLNLAQGGETEVVDGLWASGDFFTTLGVSALVGRTFSAADDVRGGGPDGPVAVISYGLWQRRFGGAATVIGTPMVVERVPFTIIGVTPPEFFGAEIGRAFDIALPIGAEPLIYGQNSKLDRDLGYWLTVMLRLKSGQSIEDGTATLRGAQAGIRVAAIPPNGPPGYERDFLSHPFALVSAAAGTSQLRQRYWRPVLAMLVIVALVLLIACGNLANLLLARAAARRHEFSVRLALGASLGHLVRQLLAESLILAGIGAAVGLVVAAWGSRALVAQLSNHFDPVFLDLSLDWRVMGFTATVAVATAVLFGTAPALRATRIPPIDALKTQGRGGSGASRVGLSTGLVVGQVALALTLVVVAGLFVRTYERLASLPLGFDSERVLVVAVDATRAQPDPANRLGFYHQLVGAVAAVPGVTSAAVSMVTPVGGLGMIEIIDIPGAASASERERTVQLNYITPGWFATYGTAIRLGRDLDDRDTKDAPRVFVVNEAFVRKFLRGQDPIGGTVANAVRARGQIQVLKTVVGVVEDAVYRSVRADVPPTVYAPLSQLRTTPGIVAISVRASAGSPVALERSVAAGLTAVDRDLTFSFRPLADQVNESLTQERLVAILSGFFGVLSLLLAALGLYGVTSYAVSRQRTEIGIRMALGAAPRSVMNLVLFRVFILITFGVVIGGLMSLWASRFIATLLYGLEPRDPATLIASAVVLASVATVAGWLPAWRASRIDPAEVLRES